MAAGSSEKVYTAIDLKSFYASVECRERGIDPLTARLVVADETRTQKTICLAVSPALKAFGISGRARLFEVVQRVDELNKTRPENDKIDFIVASPRMSLYIKYSTLIYSIYLRFVSEEDIHVYSVDEVMIDLTDYLQLYGVSPRELVRRMIREVYKETGITATAGIGPNLYLAKVAMDIEAKHAVPDADGVRIAVLSERSYRELLWGHRPLTDFWRVGRGYARKLEQAGIFTMGDIARCSIGKPGEYYNEDLLYRMFGVNAELLIDHAWGWEPCTIAQIKAYTPKSESLGEGQVLPTPYPFQKGRLIVREMAERLAMQLLDKRLTAGQAVLTVIYDIENLTDPEIRGKYTGEIQKDWYGRQVPKHAHGTWNLPAPTSSASEIMEAFSSLYERIVNPDLLVRRLYLTLGHLKDESQTEEADQYVQMDLFTDFALDDTESPEEKAGKDKERKAQEAILEIRRKYGSNAVLRGMNLEEGATARSRNRQIGGHKA